MTHRFSRLPRLVLVLLPALASLAHPRVAAAAPAGPNRPNVLWFVIDDMSPHFASNGEKLVATPHVDRLAAEGTRFTRAYVTAPVCSTSRSALITGMYQTTIGAHHHRSGRGALKIHLPPGVTPVPALLRQAGYYTCIGSGLPGRDHRNLPLPAVNAKGRPAGRPPLGKTDYNFEWDPAIYDSHDWAGRRPGQPFFMQVQLHGGKLREGPPETRAAFRQRSRDELGTPTDPQRVVLPPYYPRDPVLLEDWAAYLDSVRITDRHVGEVIARLEREGQWEHTLVLFITDHGISHARGKQFLYDEGTHIPFVARGPGVPRGAVRTDLVEHIDLAAITLAAAGLPLPAHLQARNPLAPDYRPRSAVFAARDRCDETVERIRSVRTDRYLYIRNFLPDRPHLQPNAYKDAKPILQALRALHAAGRLDPLSEELLFRPTRPSEELYDTSADPAQIRNLAGDPAHRTALEAHRAQLDTWLRDSRDPGAESDARYDSDMAEYLKRRNPEVERNIALMKRWAAEGR